MWYQRLTMGASSTLAFFECKLHSFVMSDDPKFPSQLAERFQIRMPDGLRNRIRDAAVRNNRSMNAEIIAALEKEYPALDAEQSIYALMKEWGPKIYAEVDQNRAADMVEELNERIGEVSPDYRAGYVNLNGETKLVLFFEDPAAIEYETKRVYSKKFKTEL